MKPIMWNTGFRTAYLLRLQVVFFYMKLLDTIGNVSREFALTPTNEIPEGEEVSVEIGKSTEDDAGNKSEETISRPFENDNTDKVVYDASPPEVEQVVHKVGEYFITFNESINPDTTTKSMEITNSGGTVSGTVTTINERTSKFTPDEVLKAKEENTLWVRSKLEDMSGKKINEFFHNFVVRNDDFLVYKKADPNVHDESQIGNNYLFHGRTFEPETGLYYYRYRYYLPRIGRFLQNDPMEYKDSMNMYQAFNQNPVNFVDPMGLDSDAGSIAVNLTRGNTQSKRRGELFLEGAVNTGMSLVQWLAHMFIANHDSSHYDRPWVYVNANFTRKGGDFHASLDSRGSGGIMLGMVTDPIHGVSEWGANIILACDPNISSEYGVMFAEDAIRQTPGAILVIYTTGKGARALAKAGANKLAPSPKTTSLVHYRTYWRNMPQILDYRTNSAGYTSVLYALSGDNIAINNHARLPKTFSKKTVSTTGETKTLSGWANKPEGYTSVSPTAILEVSREMGHPVKKSGALDRGVNGRYFACHAERQAAIANKGPVYHVSSAMCTDCKLWYNNFAEFAGRNLIVRDPFIARVFCLDGAIVEIKIMR